MRVKNEAQFLDRAIHTHIGALDELVIVYNDCTDETPEIAARWAHRLPDKIKVAEYGPKVVPIGTPGALTIDPRSPHCIANYYNFALSQTSRTIVIKIDGDHLAVVPRFTKICDRVRRALPPGQHYPVYGLNITLRDGEIAVYNYYGFSPEFVGNGAAKKGPPPFTSGDHCFYYVDKACWHNVDPIEGYEVMDQSTRPRFRDAPFTYSFFHLKGFKDDRGTINWASPDGHQLRAAWIKNVLAPRAEDLTSVESMRRHNPTYFRGANLVRELREAFPDRRVWVARDDGIPPIGVRERLADLWYRIAYP